jgi:hypothetical protein
VAFAHWARLSAAGLSLIFASEDVLQDNELQHPHQMRKQMSTSSPELLCSLDELDNLSLRSTVEQNTAARKTNEKNAGSWKLGILLCSHAFDR